LLTCDFESPSKGLDYVLHPCERLGNLGVVGMFARLHVYQHRVRVGEEKVVGNVVTDNALHSAPDQEWLRHNEFDRLVEVGHQEATQLQARFVDDVCRHGRRPVAARVVALAVVPPKCSERQRGSQQVVSRAVCRYFDDIAVVNSICSDAAELSGFRRTDSDSSTSVDSVRGSSPISVSSDVC
jgi:hypothetical protein